MEFLPFQSVPPPQSVLQKNCCYLQNSKDENKILFNNYAVVVPAFESFLQLKPDKIWFVSEIHNPIEMCLLRNFDGGTCELKPRLGTLVPYPVFFTTYDLALTLKLGL